MFTALGRFAHRRRVVLVVSGALFLVLSGVFGFGLFPRLKGGGYLNPRSESARVAELLSGRFEGSGQPLVLLFHGRGGQTVYSGAYRKAVVEVLKRVEAFPKTMGVLSYFSTGALTFVSEDRTATFAVVAIEPGPDRVERVRALRQLVRSDGLDVQVGGVPAVEADVLEQVGHDLKLAEAVTLPIVALLLLFIFGSVTAAILPLAIGGLAILGAFLLLRLLTHVTDLSVFSVNVISMLGLGLAIDYSLLVVSRYREELLHRHDERAALVRTMETAGHTVLFSGLTVTLSLLSLLLFPQMVLRSMGVGGAVAVLFAVLASLTVLPALLALLGHRVNALALRRSVRRPATAEVHGFWYRLSHFVMRRPLLILALTLPPLLLAGSPFLHVRFAMPDERNLPRGLESRNVAEQLKREFATNQLAPMELVVRFGAPLFTAERIDALFDYTRRLAQVPGVQSVGSLVNLDPRLDAGGKEAYRQLWVPGAASGQMADFLASAGDRLEAAKRQFSSGELGRVRLLYGADPQSDEAKALVKRVRAVAPPEGALVLVGGESAELVDLLSDMRRTVPWAFGTIGVVIFTLLFLMLGSLVVPAKAVILNLLSLSASFGALVWIFQDGHLAHWMGFEPLGRIDALQPVLVFVIAFGLSMDYEVFLLGRIREMYDQTGDNSTAVALGLERTGGIITSAAALLIVVIAGFALGKVLSLKQVGVGLVVAVFVDATLLRSLLVPATMRLLGHLNWWAPRPLARFYRKLGWAEPGESASK